MVFCLGRSGCSVHTENRLSDERGKAGKEDDSHRLLPCCGAKGYHVIESVCNGDVWDVPLHSRTSWHDSVGSEHW
jgi:hypothetical protein